MYAGHARAASVHHLRLTTSASMSTAITARVRMHAMCTVRVTHRPELPCMHTWPGVRASCPRNHRMCQQPLQTVHVVPRA